MKYNEIQISNTLIMKSNVYKTSVLTTGVSSINF